MKLYIFLFLSIFPFTAYACSALPSNDIVIKIMIINISTLIIFLGLCYHLIIKAKIKKFYKHYLVAILFIVYILFFTNIGEKVIKWENPCSEWNNLNKGV